MTRPLIQLGKWLLGKVSENKESAGLSAVTGGAGLAFVLVFGYNTFVTQKDFEKEIASDQAQIHALWTEVRLENYELAIHGIVVPVIMPSTNNIDK